MFNFFGLRIGRYTLFEKRVSQNLCCCDLYDENVRIVRDLKGVDLGPLGIQADAVSKLLEHGIDLFVYFDGDIPLGVMCGHLGSCYIRGPGIPLIQDDETVYWFWIFTAPEARGKNIFNKMQRKFFNYYKDAKCFTAFVDPRNVIMYKQMLKMDFVELYKYFFINFCGYSLIFKTEINDNLSNICFESGNKRKLFLI
jgi:hypothetical protein